MNACLPFKPIIFDSNKQFHLEIISDLMCYGDESRLKQVLIILLDNAIKNTPPQGDITLELKMHTNKLQVTSSPEGPTCFMVTLPLKNIESLQNS